MFWVIARVRELASSGTGHRIARFDALGQRMLDAGTIDFESLELSESTLTWINDGTSRSAVLY
jgi:hypothetical protein